MIARKPKEQRESAIQQALFKYFQLSYPSYKKLFIKVSNEGKRTPKNGARMKAEGLQRGFPDVVLFIPRTHKGKLYYGFCLELKAEEGKISEEQKEYLHLLGQQGYATGLAYGLEAAQALIDRYMKDDYA